MLFSMAQTSALLAYLEEPCLMLEERQPKRHRATEQQSLVNMPLHWTDEFWLEEAKDFTSQDASLAGGHHPRRPDLAMEICIYMKTTLNLSRFFKACNPSKTLVMGDVADRHYSIDFSLLLSSLENITELIEIS